MSEASFFLVALAILSDQFSSCRPTKHDVALQWIRHSLYIMCVSWDFLEDNAMRRANYVQSLLKNLTMSRLILPAWSTFFSCARHHVRRASTWMIWYTWCGAVRLISNCDTADRNFHGALPVCKVQFGARMVPCWPLKASPCSALPRGPQRTSHDILLDCCTGDAKDESSKSSPNYHIS